MIMKYVSTTARVQSIVLVRYLAVISYDSKQSKSTSTGSSDNSLLPYAKKADILRDTIYFSVQKTTTIQHVAFSKITKCVICLNDD